jgi:hypothetical protein
MKWRRHDIQQNDTQYNNFNAILWCTFCRQDLCRYAECCGANEMINNNKKELNIIRNLTILFFFRRSQFREGAQVRSLLVGRWWPAASRYWSAGEPICWSFLRIIYMRENCCVFGLLTRDLVVLSLPRLAVISNWFFLHFIFIYIFGFAQEQVSYNEWNLPERPKAKLLILSTNHY